MRQGFEHRSDRRAAEYIMYGGAGKPLILTTGEPAGVGPDLCIQLASELSQMPVVLCGDIDLLRQRAQQLGVNVVFYHDYEMHSQQAPALAVRHTSLIAPATPGVLNVANAAYVLSTLDIALKGTLSGRYAGIVTAPVHKGIICQSGRVFRGHTEFFAEHTNSKQPVMVLATEALKVALVTTHLPLVSVPAAVTTEKLTAVLTIIERDMRRYFTSERAPKIAVCGLNPHAGESGHLGREECDIINPTLRKLRASGFDVTEALPADTLFIQQKADAFDIIVAMYHDQGLPVIKAKGFSKCVNLTFGLPFIRTSVDHGTALDLAGSDRANSGSLRCALALARSMISCKVPPCKNIE